MAIVASLVAVPDNFTATTIVWAFGNPPHSRWPAGLITHLQSRSNRWCVQSMTPTTAVPVTYRTVQGRAAHTHVAFNPLVGPSSSGLAGPTAGGINGTVVYVRTR